MDSVNILVVTVALFVCSWVATGNKARIAALEAEVAQLRVLVVDAETEVGK